MSEPSNNLTPEPAQASQPLVLDAYHHERLRMLFRLIVDQPEGRYLFDLMCRYRAN